MPISALNSSVAAMYRATDRFESSATKIAQPGPETDLAGEVVNAIGAEQDFMLATKLIRIAQDMQEHAVDILA